MFQSKRLQLVSRRTVQMINFGMGKIIEEVWFDPKKNRNVIKTVIV
ncbi:hypothetical protein pEaSNUABM22_00196 [Erwinia phage pEa_SNUABM_22]|uniref:Uncharacterized protein n=2 Tax=Alexandravirus TaxID=2733088 RepID=A0AAE9BUE8_9CAUD|nr:hypothetical protein MPK63_gp195 [Erwinia phage pEa_SNUABM_22]YP_010299957.1 hypothetical protein MPK64_gp196 [Erwinia phage pEa_SNUABM_16]QZE59099.1 hypothetical protein pEaSNUABM18_00196 [Erwinia phage pEa_SNUABM_18]WAK44607.1 hypothetical protein [Erwinia phage vB_Ea_2910A]UAW96340.1 hypothetical protein pEaSNUABM16_00196 [Erwinia phage pEa_SNUABM_16]UAW96683.1 hypothetical protein pEaSNUABM22_00196 [Erwinia phage pEa_SNUABM_22]